MLSTFLQPPAGLTLQVMSLEGNLSCSRCPTSKGDGFELHQGRFRLDNRKSFSARVVAQAAQGGGTVTVPGGVQELWRCGTEVCGQWVWWDGLGLDLMVSVVFSNLNDSMTLRH